MAQSGLNKRDRSEELEIWKTSRNIVGRELFWGLRVGLCLTVGGELSEDTQTHTYTDKAKDFIGKGGEWQGT